MDWRKFENCFSMIGVDYKLQITDTHRVMNHLFKLRYKRYTYSDEYIIQVE